MAAGKLLRFVITTVSVGHENMIFQHEHGEIEPAAHLFGKGSYIVSITLQGLFPIHERSNTIAFGLGVLSSG